MCILKRRTYIKIQTFTQQHRKVLLLSSSISAAVLLILLSLNSNVLIPSSDPTQAISNQVEPLAYTCCTPLNKPLRTNIYFVKTHKTGSSTVKNVIIRFALMNSLDIMSIIYQTYYLPISDQSIHPNAKTPNNKYHIMAHHIRYNLIIKSYQYPDTSMVTILRHPVTQFESKYDYYAMGKVTGLTLQQFLNAPIKPPLLGLLGVSSYKAYRGYNQMSVDLGFDANQSGNETAVAEFIEKIDREFDFVMIMEHMDASMVLLANLMGWPLENVAYLNINTRLPRPNTYKLTSRDESTIMDLNQVDTLLYNHFETKFSKCVQQYGEQRMNGQIQRLKIISQQFAVRCVTGEVKKQMQHGISEIAHHVPKNASDSECVYAVTSLSALDDIIREIQFQRYARMKHYEAF